jgi:hypothetical protein
MDRRGFLKVTALELTGLVVAASVLDALPVAAAGPSTVVPDAPIRALGTASTAAVARLTIREAGTYRISGLVRLDAPVVEISGIANAQQISWSAIDGVESPVASFTSFEQFAGPGLTPEIQVRGGHLESLSVVPMDFQ